jgi:PncC family amidohydrolase
MTHRPGTGSILIRRAEQVAMLLSAVDRKLVLAESCTSGLIAASLGRIPGISHYFCGSAVTYRESVKQAWLSVRGRDLERYSAVSDPVARQMAVGILKATDEADYAASVTGHLGPDAPAIQDGLVFVAIAVRLGRLIRIRHSAKRVLQSQSRIARRNEAASITLELLAQAIEQERDR